MRNLLVLVIVAMFSVSELVLAANPGDQAQTTAQDKVASLRAQLVEVETRQADLQTHLQRLEEALKPENIESRLAGVGSTHPEDLREQRRRQLEIERNGVQKQLELLTTSHTRLETAIAQAETEAYRQSAKPDNGPSINTATGNEDATVSSATPTRPRRTRKKKSKRSRRLHHYPTLR